MSIDHLPTKEHLAKVWHEHSDTIKVFLAQHDNYTQLSREVAYILEQQLHRAQIEVSAVSSRAKALTSFLEKLSRKRYDDPLQQVTDLAGCKVIYLYRSDRHAIEQVIEREFTILEKIDKFDEHDSERIGYDALHYLVKLSDKAQGVRYDNLRPFVCEVQVRTVLQEAWAAIDHHLVYKQESCIPKALRRKFSTFSALFENADDQFDQIRRERHNYKQEVQALMENPSSFLMQDLNLDTFVRFLAWRFPENDSSYMEDSPFYAEQIQTLISALRRLRVSSLEQLEQLLKKTDKASQAMSERLPPDSPIDTIAHAVALSDEEFRDTMFNEAARETIARYIDYVETPM